MEVQVEIIRFVEMGSFSSVCCTGQGTKGAVGPLGLEWATLLLVQLQLPREQHVSGNARLRTVSKAALSEKQGEAVSLPL